MSRRAPRPTVLRESIDDIALETDVLVIGGGPAALWTALRALENGARVLVVDKGYAGASGVAAPAGVGHWLVPPDPHARDREISVREAAGGHLTDRNWTNDVLDVTWERTSHLPSWGHWTSPNAVAAFAAPTGGVPRRSFLGQAPAYLRFLRGRAIKLGAKVLDHSPALELLRDADGVVSGARGFQRQQERSWQAAAKAVVLATGGTTWKSKSLGADVNTGDGHLMALEVGADVQLSSMEFSNFYGMVPFGTSMDKNGFFIAASYTDAAGDPIDHGNLHESRTPLLAASLRTTVHAQFTQFTTPEQVEAARAGMPNFFMVADKIGVDPVAERFPIDWVHEGTVRGTGGIRIHDRTTTFGVPGLFAAGDIAARDRITGAATGAGGPNLAWAVATGTWAGDAAVAFSAGRSVPDPDRLERTGTVGLRPTGAAGANWRALLATVQGEMLPIEKSVLRSDEGLRASVAVLDRAWEEAVAGLRGSGAEAIRTREVAALLAMARWADRTAIERRESRGMHTRIDHPETDPGQSHRLLTSGLHEIEVAVDPDAPVVGRRELEEVS